LLAALNPDFFILYFQQRLSPQLGYVEVVRYDQLLLLSTDDRAEPGSVAVDGEIESRLAMSEMGQFEDTALNGEKTLTSYRVTRQFPLLVVVRLHRSEALSAWADESRRLLLVVGPSLLGMIILSIFLYRYQQRLVVKEVAARRREHERLAATVLANVAEAVMVTGMDNRIITVNPAFSRISGYSAAEVIGSPPEIFGAESQTATFQQEIQQALDEQGLWAGEVRHRRKNGELFVAWLSTNLVRDEAGQVTHRVTVFSDFSEHRAEVDRIEYLAHHDMLTGLPNRTLLLDRLRQGISTARRQKHLLGLIFMDLDKFKPVNDQFGHAVGDLLLQKVAERLVSTVRAADTVVRLGGDEFVVLLPILDSKKSALKIAEKLRQNLNRPFILEGQQVSISSSSGIALFPEDGANEGELLRHADSVMYRAKQDGGNRTEYT
jgi:diguanylate cyclase (GGDEF)-like protein/PAS domain S-box-containing protein